MDKPQILNDTDEVDLGEDRNGKWFVQAASFKDKGRAYQLVRQLKKKNIISAVIVRGNYYTVRLQYQRNRRLAEKLNKKLYSTIGLKGMIFEYKSKK
jgi:cell division septation protein DedD